MTSPDAYDARFWETEPNIPLTRTPDNPDHNVGKAPNAKRAYPRHRREIARAEDIETGAMVALIPSDADAARLAVAGGEDRGQLHTTLVFLGEAADFNDHVRSAITGTVSAIAERFGPIDANGFALSAFNPGDANDRPTCIVLGLSGPGLQSIHDLVAKAIVDLTAITGPALPVVPEPWAPHLTLVYTTDLLQIGGMTDQVGPVVFDRVRIAFGGTNTDIPLTGSLESRPD